MNENMRNVLMVRSATLRQSLLIIEVSTLEILLCQIGFALISKGPFNKFHLLILMISGKDILKF